MRIGLHSGPAIVGDMDSHLRFDYTALGDTVNLASRLEGVNKTYGTNILLSADTAKQIGSAIELRRVDRVRVKGKAVAIDIFTPCDDSKLSRITGMAWEAYTGRAWDRAEGYWLQIRELAPADPLSRVFLERIAEYRAAPPRQDWDGSVALEKL